MNRRAIGSAKVDGGAAYVADVRAPEALHVAFVHSPFPHARVTGVDTSDALAMPGVVDVLTHREIGEILLGRALRDYPVLAGDRVLCAGQRVAAVAAVDPATAVAAAAAVDVGYEPLPEITGLDEAMGTDDPLHPRYAEYPGAVSDRPGPNAQGIWATEEGEVDPMFAAAGHVFDHTFTAARNHSAPLEPHACLVSVTEGRVDIWATHKEPFNLRRLVAEVGNVPVDTVRVHLSPVGGDFGSKGFPYVEIACYLLARRTGRPVRHTMSYDEELTTTATRHPAKVRLRTAVTGGVVRALHAETVIDGGAFGGVKAVPMVVIPTIHAPYGSYAVANRRESCVSYYSNNLPGGHVRAPGEFQALFASESQVDVIAHELGIDPVEFRHANAANARVRRIVAELRETVGKWRAESSGKRGVGVALTFRDTGPGLSTVRCVVASDGVRIELSVVDQGSGSYSLFERLAAETLGVPREFIRIQAVDVGADPALQDSGTGASRVTAVAGTAVVESCRAALAELGGAPGERGGYWPFRRLAELGVPSVVAEGTAAAGWPAPPDVDVRSHAGIAVEVGVDEETGRIDVRRALLVADTGRVFNEVAHRGQLEGGFVYGLSQTLLEELIVEDGAVVTATLGDYRIASAADVPPLEVRVLEPAAADDDAVKSVGELVNIGVAPAVANAVFDAVGVRLHDLPLTAERVLAALKAGARR
ncbi:xanthine dehydrogenase family protein molybdopterin-binding subunit [Amycolatopsis sp. SID8362]|uniref:xanthine dehydrogenase family protein molybdopterin-binding subunit n=1 Tax=Amycolatopsis sp. SID8362 TaxID=2690346 RepID=UPI00136EBD86|nr:xanthine dehydrogenase family protein molybdopterin-binding subunit [Amycolatopsis sp. SID8362]NBH07417.1 molybdopterin-dependent oxidoreductase [Amycolatopsis sp. SID8362]NED44113.1 xanthine dehydrogenase family protein molybdopterin-binding subunit [Amycolatopsis sp. SID8362]